MSIVGLFLLVSRSVESHLTNSHENEPLSVDTIFHDGTNEQNQSVLSFPDHTLSPSQQSDESINSHNRLELEAQILVDDSIQNAREQYQRV